jgi:predicted Fe-Mo cluster-binding NifX family protein
MYIFVDTETADKDHPADKHHPMEFEAVENPAIAAPGGAGIQAAQFIVERGAQAVVTGNMGPNAFSVLQSAGVPVYLFDGGTVRQAVEACRQGRLSIAGQASAPAHAGMGRGRGVGMGRGVGTGVGDRAPVPPTPPASPPTPSRSREAEIADLKEMATELRKRLAGVIERLDRLQRGE